MKDYQSLIGQPRTLQIEFSVLIHTAQLEETALTTINEATKAAINIRLPTNHTEQAQKNQLEK